ncbi:MAG: hypothetical protein IT330_18605 [Anaerolineae bacterium]|nr:hypothetical protein [Anaerolineae bacterium]
MSALDRLFRRGQAKAATTEAVMPKMTEEEARAKRTALWKEMQANPTPERAKEIAQEAAALLNYFGREHPLRDNINELIRAADSVAGRERITF